MCFKDEQSGEVVTKLRTDLREAEDAIEEKEREIKKLQKNVDDLEGVLIFTLPLTWILCQSLSFSLSAPFKITLPLLT